MLKRYQLDMSGNRFYKKYATEFSYDIRLVMGTSNIFFLKRRSFYRADYSY
uniref:Uncharacterized protein n=1 Tax=Ciona intestinalis TaxID=7719 RepID=H2XZG8_CIOIN